MPIITDLGSVLTLAEAQNLSELIKKNRDIWTHESVYWGENRVKKPINFLGSPIYPAKANPSLYNKLREKSKQFLIDNTTVMLQKTLQLVGEMYGCSTIEQLPNTSLPGFHILCSDTPCIEKYQYHQDADYLEFHREFGTTVPYKLSDFYSFSVAIELPRAGATIDFDAGAEGLRFPYEVGHSYVWRGGDLHKIGDVHLAGNTDYRITFQSHCVIQQNKLLYYW